MGSDTRASLNFHTLLKQPAALQFLDKHLLHEL